LCFEGEEAVAANRDDASVVRRGGVGNVNSRGAFLKKISIEGEGAEF
jgi:hypothetical protein